MSATYDKPREAFTRFAQIATELAELDAKRAELLAEQGELRPRLLPLLDDGKPVCLRLRVGRYYSDEKYFLAQRTGAAISMDPITPDNLYDMEWPAQPPADSPDVLPMNDGAANVA